MSWTSLHRWLGAALCILLAGCTPCDLVERTIKWEPSAFWWKSDRDRSRDVYKKWADQAWLQEGQGCASSASTSDYEAGFKIGFVDYVFAGGTGEPPPVPPRMFWNMDLRLPEGRERANQWFAGYRHGSRVARDSGYRELAQVQSSLSESPGMAAYGPPRGGPPEQFDMQGTAWPQPQELQPEELPAQVPTLNAPATSNEGAPATSQPLPSNAPADTHVEQLEDRLHSSPAPEDIQLPNPGKRLPTSGKPAAAPSHAPRQPGDSAARTPTLRLTSDPQFQW